MTKNTERPKAEGFAWHGDRPICATTPRRRPDGTVDGYQGLPPDDDHHFIYQVGFPALDHPSHAEAIVFVWSDQPVMDELELRQQAVLVMSLMVERGA